MVHPVARVAPVWRVWPPNPTPRSPQTKRAGSTEVLLVPPAGLDFQKRTQTPKISTEPARVRSRIQMSSVPGTCRHMDKGRPSNASCCEHLDKMHAGPDLRWCWCEQGWLVGIYSSDSSSWNGEPKSSVAINSHRSWCETCQQKRRHPHWLHNKFPRKRMPGLRVVKSLKRKKAHRWSRVSNQWLSGVHLTLRVSKHCGRGQHAKHVQPNVGCGWGPGWASPHTRHYLGHCGP